MTRGHTPPPSLTSEDIMSLAQVRKDIWINAMKGFAVGGASCFLLHRAAMFANSKKWVAMNLNRNTAFASVMVGSALGSFLFATTEGKNSVHTLHPLFQRGAHPPNGDNTTGIKNDNYQKSLLRAKERNDDLRDLQQRQLLRSASNDDGEAERLELERNRVMRRASLSRAMTGGRGLSDSHGGHWVQDEFRKE